TRVPGGRSLCVRQSSRSDAADRQRDVLPGAVLCAYWAGRLAFSPARAARGTPPACVARTVADGSAQLAGARASGAAATHPGWTWGHGRGAAAVRRPARCLANRGGVAGNTGGGRASAGTLAAPFSPPPCLTLAVCKSLLAKIEGWSFIK